MSKLDDLHTLIRLLNEFGFPVSPILEYAIKEKEEELCGNEGLLCEDISHIDDVLYEKEKEITFTSVKEGFRHYIYKAKSKRTADNYLRYIEKPIRRHINKIVNPEADSIYSFKTIEDLKTCIFKLKANEEFVNDNLRWHNAMTAALTCYSHYLENKENS